MNTVPLGEILRFAGIPERINKPASETFVTVRLNGGGAVRRNIGAGKTPVAFTGYRVRTGQFIYSRIDARNGAFALVPNALDGAVVSKDFPVFDIQADVVDTQYLIQYFRAGRLQHEIQALSLGATNRQRITEGRFLSFWIPLPPLPEQRRIAAILDHADALRAKRRQTLAYLDSLSRSTLTQFLRSVPTRECQLIDLIDGDDRLNYGVVQPGNNVAGGVPLVRVSDLNNGRVDRTGLKFIDPELERAYARSRLRGTEILVSCVGSIGVIAVADSVDIGSNVARAVARVPISDPILRMYVASFLASEEPQCYFTRELRTVSQPTLNIKQLGETRVLVPERSDLVRVVERFGAIADLVRDSRRSTQIHDALFTSLQSRAFRGEL